MLRYLMESLDQHDDICGPLLPLDDAWRLLTAAAAVDPPAVDRILTWPTVGLWAVQTARRSMHPHPAVQPLWLDVGYLHSLAAASAIRAGLDFQLAVPVTHGTVTLPTIGAATLPLKSGTAVVHSRDGRVTITAGDVSVPADDGHPSWHPSIVVEIDGGGTSLSVELLDRDPFRDARRPTPPAPLSAAQIEKWRSNLEQAWTILVREQPGRAPSISATLRALTPLPAAEPYRPLSASGVESFGGALLSAPDDPTQLAMTLVHETQHNKLGALLHLLTLTKEAASVRFYAPWRDDPRPLSGLLQGVYAFSGIVDFWQVHRRNVAGGEAAVAHFEFALWRRQVSVGLRTLAGSGLLTDSGKRFVSHLLNRMQGVVDLPVPECALTAARRMAADHRSMWRGHNVRLGPAAEEILMTAWERGDPLPSALFRDGGPNAAVVAEPDIGWFDTRAVLTRQYLFTGAVGPAPVEGATAPDHALITGDHDQARQGYLKALSREPASTHLWVGYALAGGGPETSALMGRPELVLAVARHQSAGAADPERLAAWIQAGIPAHMLAEPDPVSWRVDG
ncbi:HEXXH motif-containing protein [Actinoplanes italicus]|uniref:HEXXH motif-containing protein n=2 Tax=Actinoplanes italicus TaxID=113567 RepID=A0A2T0KG61_9ACTN|nr:HEXXH motif-containing protein [Actinoplanes italicus]